MARAAPRKQHSESPEPVCAEPRNATHPAERFPSEIARPASHVFSSIPPLTSSETVPLQHIRIPVVGIVGGVGAGKSTVVRNVAGLQLFVIDADRIGHELLQTNLIRNRLRVAFGDEIINEAGKVERKRLAEKVFGDSDEQTQNLSRLNEILHPAIRTEIQYSINQAPQDADAIILDAALLLETGWGEGCDAVVFIDTPLEKRQQRVAVNRRWSIEELQRREASQWSLLRKREAAEFIIDNSNSLETAVQQMTEIIKQIKHRTRTGTNPQQDHATLWEPKPEASA